MGRGADITGRMENDQKQPQIPNDLLFPGDFSSELGFMLTKFSFFELTFVPLERPQFQANIHKFLKAQRDSLKAVTIEECLGLDILKTILSMPRLRNLEIERKHGESTIMNFERGCRKTAAFLPHEKIGKIGSLMLTLLSLRVGCFRLVHGKVLK